MTPGYDFISAVAIAILERLPERHESRLPQTATTQEAK
jgi:hypothetical protein